MQTSVTIKNAKIAVMVRSANICYTRNANNDLLCLGMQTSVTLRDAIMCYP